MLLSVVLIVLSLILIAIFVGMVIWWRKFGKSFFEMSKNLTKINQNTMKNMNFNDFSKNFDQQMKIIENFMKKRK